MRYAESKYGEQPIAVGIFQTNDVVTIEVFDISDPATGPGDGVVSLSDATCVEVTRTAAPHTGFFVWDSSNFTTQPSNFDQLVYIMSNAAGREHPGKFVVGGYPSDSAIRRFENFVHVMTGGASGIDWDKGTPTKPVASLDDALTIAGNNFLSAYMIRGAFSTDVDHESWSWEGIEPTDDNITFIAPALTTGSQFARVGMIGTFDGRITAQECTLGACTDINGLLNTCGITGPILIKGGETLQGLDLASQVLIPGAVIDLQNTTGTVFLGGKLSGNWVIRNVVSGCLVGMAMAGGSVTLENTVVGGILQLFGTGELYDSSGVGATVLNGLVQGTLLDVAVSTRSTPAQITAAQAAIQVDISNLENISIADVQTALTNQGYTAGRAPNLDNLDASILSRAIAGDQMALTATAIAAVADAVLLEPVGDHEGTADSLAAVVRRISHHTVGRAKFNTADDAQWRLDIYEDDDRTAVTETFDLKRLDGTAINLANPDPLVDDLIADTDPV